MHSHRVLISTFFLASAALADRNAASGGVIITSPHNGTFQSIATTLQVPHMWGKSEDAAAAFISFDDEECPTFVQLGINFRASLSGHSYYEAWFASPGSVYTLPTDYFRVNAEDIIELKITAPSKDAPTGSLSLVNTNIRLNRTLPFTPEYKPCGKKVKWFMASVPYGGNATDYHNICNLGTLNFTGAVAYGPTGQIYGPQDKMAHTTNVSFHNGTKVATAKSGQNLVTFKYL